MITCFNFKVAWPVYASICKGQCSLDYIHKCKHGITVSPTVTYLYFCIKIYFLRSVATFSVYSELCSTVLFFLQNVDNRCTSEHVRQITYEWITIVNENKY